MQRVVFEKFSNSKKALVENCETEKRGLGKSKKTIHMHGDEEDLSPQPFVVPPQASEVSFF